MSRYIERSMVVEATLSGAFRIEPQRPLEVLVSRASQTGLVDPSQEPFWAYTAQLVAKICGSGGVQLQGGDVLPWKVFEKGGLTVVRFVPFKQGLRPVIDFSPLLK